MTEEEFDIIYKDFLNARDKFEKAESAIKEIRRERKPEVGDRVRFELSLGPCGLGRYIGDNKVLWIDDWYNKLCVSPISIDSDWSNYGNQKTFPSDEQVKEYAKKYEAVR